jgi:hypothetical protein
MGHSVHAGTLKILQKITFRPCIYYIHEVSHQWLMPIILATWEAEIKRIAGQYRQIVCKTPL